jgi:hypothetical protein
MLFFIVSEARKRPRAMEAVATREPQAPLQGDVFIDWQAIARDALAHSRNIAETYLLEPVPPGYSTLFPQLPESITNLIDRIRPPSPMATPSPPGPSDMPYPQTLEYLEELTPQPLIPSGDGPCNFCGQWERFEALFPPSGDDDDDEDNIPRSIEHEQRGKPCLSLALRTCPTDEEEAIAVNADRLSFLPSSWQSELLGTLRELSSEYERWNCVSAALFSHIAQERSELLRKYDERSDRLMRLQNWAQTLTNDLIRSLSKLLVGDFQKEATLFMTDLPYLDIYYVYNRMKRISGWPVHLLEQCRQIRDTKRLASEICKDMDETLGEIRKMCPQRYFYRKRRQNSQSAILRRIGRQLGEFDHYDSE